MILTKRDGDKVATLFVRIVVSKYLGQQDSRVAIDIG
jgi:hypothetical protein